MLLSKKLCTARELRRCASCVRRLASDLPGFDSVWLDALVQRRVLTSFQARSIEAQEYDRLTIGPSIVLDQVGHGPDSETYLTKLPHERATCIVKRVSVATELRGQTLKRLQRLTERGRHCQHPGVVIPHASRELPPGEHGRRGGPSAGLTTQTRLAIVSRPTEGLTLAQMLLRRGRFSENVVLEVARQLLDAVSALHDCKLVHGEIRLENLLLSSRGQVVMVDCGVRPAIRPAFEITAFVDPERNDGIAPELIGTGDPATPSTDLYAIGCILWQLLAGRPAHPTGDPLAKLAAHQTERIPDVRDLAPETSDRLAEAILWLTAPDSKARPAHGRDVFTGTSPQKTDTSRPALGPAGRRSRSVLARFAGQFQHPVARSSDPTRRPRTSRRMALAMAAMVVAVAVLHVFPGHNPLPASIDQFGSWLKSQYSTLASDGPVPGETPDGPATGEQLGYEALPEPSDDGTISLPHAGPWQASSIVWSGARLTIVGPDDQRAQIRIGDESLRLDASEIRLENIELLIETAAPGIIPPGPAAAGPRPAIVCRSQSLTMIGCLVHGTRIAAATPHSAEPGEAAQEFRHPVCLSWMPLDASDALAGQVRIEDCQFMGRMSTIELRSPTRVLRCRNVLKVSGGPLFVIGPDPQPVSRTVDLDRVTLRNSTSLIEVRLDGESPQAGRSRLELRPKNCVFSLHAWDSPPSLVAYTGRQLPHDWDRFLSIDGEGSIAAPGTRVVSLQSTDGQQRLLLDESGVSLRGLLSAAIEFRNDRSWFEPADSVVSRIAANRRSSDLPGFQEP